MQVMDGKLDGKVDRSEIEDLWSDALREQRNPISRGWQPVQCHDVTPAKLKDQLALAGLVAEQQKVCN